VEDITEDGNGRIVVRIVPDESNFRSGVAMWEVHSTENGSRVVHYARIEPDVWVPPWLGSAIVKDTLRKELKESFENLECLSRAVCEPEKEIIVKKSKVLLEDDTMEDLAG
jgi:hypothetical protein